MKFFYFILICLLTCVKANAQVDKPSYERLKPYIDSLNKENTINDQPSEDNFYFFMFMNQATIGELTALTDHSSPIIRCYAFRGLTEKKCSDIQNIFIKHITDTEQVYSWDHQSCIRFHGGVRDYMLRLMNPNEWSNEYRFDRKQWDYYYDLLAEMKKNEH